MSNGEKKDETKLVDGKITKVSHPFGMKATYAEVCLITATAEEFILEFGNRNTANPTELIVHTRMAISTFHAKRLKALLEKLIKRYENDFGEIIVNVADRLKKGKK